MINDITIPITKRRKTRFRKEAFDKKLIRLDREETKLYKSIPKQEWVELKPPIQRGFVRYFVTRPDVKQSRDGVFFEKLLEKINTTQFSPRNDFKRKRRRYGKKIYVEREQRLSDVREDELKKNFSEKERTYFIEAGSKMICNRRITEFRFTESWRYVLFVEPNIIRKVLTRNPVLHSRIDEISQFFRTDNRRDRLWKIQGIPNWFRSHRIDSNQKLQNALHHINNDLL
jgi:hypothetical protein